MYFCFYFDNAAVEFNELAHKSPDSYPGFRRSSP